MFSALHSAPVWVGTWLSAAAGGVRKWLPVFAFSSFVLIWQFPASAAEAAVVKLKGADASVVESRAAATPLPGDAVPLRAPLEGGSAGLKPLSPEGPGWSYYMARGAALGAVGAAVPIDPEGRKGALVDILDLRGKVTRTEDGVTLTGDAWLALAALKRRRDALRGVEGAPRDIIGVIADTALSPVEMGGILGLDSASRRDDLNEALRVSLTQTPERSDSLAEDLLRHLSGNSLLSADRITVITEDAAFSEALGATLNRPALAGLRAVVSVIPLDPFRETVLSEADFQAFLASLRAGGEDNRLLAEALQLRARAAGEGRVILAGAEPDRELSRLITEQVIVVRAVGRQA